MVERFLESADATVSTTLPPRAEWWTRALARLPLAHSLFWMVFFVVFATFGAPTGKYGQSSFAIDDTDTAPKALTLCGFAYGLSFRLATAWMVYGSIKFIITLVSCFVGISRVRKALAVKDWRTRASAKAALDKKQGAEMADAAADSAAVRGVAYVHDADAGAGGLPMPAMAHNCMRRLLHVGGSTRPHSPAAVAATDISFDDVVHIVVVPNYCEPAATLARTLDTLRDQSVAGSLVVVLAMEARDEEAHAKANLLLDTYAPAFKLGLYTVHRLCAGEVGGKSSNENWAVRCAKVRVVDELGLDPKHIVVTTCDCDTYFHPSHFGCLTAHFVGAGPVLRYERFWQAATCFYPNVDSVPALCRVRYTIISVGFLGQLVNPLAFSLPFSCYSLSLDLALRAGFWDPAVIPEDWHMYLRCFYATQGRVSVVPLYLPVGCECVYTGRSSASGSAVADVQACYTQSQRWQWGAIDLGFIIVQNWLHSTLSMGEWRFKLRQLAVLATAYEHHLLYSVMWCVLLLAPYVFRTDWSSWRTLCWAAFLAANWSCLATLDRTYRALLAGRRHFGHATSSDPGRLGGRGCLGPSAGAVDRSWWGNTGRLVELLLFPLSDLLLFVLPTFHAHAQMAASTDMTYVVAPKGDDDKAKGGAARLTDFPSPFPPAAVCAVAGPTLPVSFSKAQAPTNAVSSQATSSSERSPLLPFPTGSAAGRGAYGAQALAKGGESAEEEKGGDPYLRVLA